MLIPLPELIALQQMKITGCLHLGAHTGEEAAAYHAAGITRVWWVEADPSTIPLLQAHVAPYGHRVIEACVTDVDGGEVTFHRTNNRQSSSVLEMGTHTVVSPTVKVVDRATLPTRTVDSLVAEHGVEANFWNLDLQGAELLALRGGESALAAVDYVYSEVNIDELYIGCARLRDLDDWLDDRGFDRVATVMAGESGWGDALYVRRTALP